MIIYRPIDIEEEIRLALKDYFTIYCRPLPDDFRTPSLLVTATGGDTKNHVDTFTVVLDARAKEDADADELLRNAVAVLETQAKQQFGALRNVKLNTMGSWGADPVRPDLKMRSATLRVTAHRETAEIVFTGGQ